LLTGGRRGGSPVPVIDGRRLLPLLLLLEEAGTRQTIVENEAGEAGMVMLSEQDVQDKYKELDEKDEYPNYQN
jgi:hypothetical protein